jgi:EAL domain-containing protein (putative c-di-GMP-specific phosphodiesterase class I)
MQSFTIAVNVSAIEFRDRQFVENLRNVLDETGLDARSLQLELTESVLMRSVVSSSAVLHELKQLGVQLAIDDFGTGYSSLSYLSQFPIDVLKIDKSFVQSISSNDGNGVIVNAVIGMGTSLGQRVVAEGVETLAQLSFLHAHHCNEGQGYLFSAPVPADDFTRLIGQGVMGAVFRLQ